MRLETTLKWLITFLILTLIMDSPCIAEMKAVCFQHKVRDTITPIKKNCRKIKGKHDSFPVFKCFDEEGELKDFFPGNEWKEIDGNDPICQPDTPRGSIFGPPRGGDQRKEDQAAASKGGDEEGEKKKVQDKDKTKK